MISDRIQTYNQLIKDTGNPRYSLYTLTTGQTSTVEKISMLENKIQAKIPESLSLFYQQLGNISSSDYNESNCINVFSVDYLLEKLACSDKWEKLRGLGILDMILFSWENDRYEIQELDTEVIEHLNSNYFSFGWLRTDDGLEAATYLYFDRSGNFGSFPYHQDDFDDLQTNYLLPLMTKSLATQTFEEVILESFDMITNSKKQELGN